MPIPAEIGDLIVRRCVLSEYPDCEIIFSGLDSNIADEVEMAFLKADFAIFSNASSHRLKTPLIPLCLPPVNINHLEIVPTIRQQYKLNKGFLVCNSNCAVVGIAIPLKALTALGHIEEASIVTMQAVSGAGYDPGVSSMDILDNVVPYIPGEEDKIKAEARKILGTLKTDLTGFIDQKIRLSVCCNRVPVLDGHTACISLRFARRPPPTLNEVRKTMKEYTSAIQLMGCPSAPQQMINVMDELDRPQPRLDRDKAGGYTTSVGRVREDPSGVFDFQMVTLIHNTIIGAAGSSILNSEAAILKCYL
ncbi:MAG: hypothetical protein Q9167_007473 [Letrouitia subvulpina]